MTLPHEKDPALLKKEGIKYDAGKTRFALVPIHSLEALARVFTIGALKYEPWNWAKGMDWSRVSDAMERHLAEWKKGVPLDPETALQHLAQVAWGAFVLLEYERLGIGKDDRWVPDRVGALTEAAERMTRSSSEAAKEGNTERAQRLSAGADALSDLLCRTRHAEAQRTRLVEKAVLGSPGCEQCEDENLKGIHTCEEKRPKGPMRGSVKGSEP